MSVRLDSQGPVSVLTIDRPDSYNSFDLDAARQLNSTVRAAIAEDATDAIVLEGAGEAFCTGADLTAFHDALEKGRARELVREVSTTMNEVIRKICHGDKPVVAAVDGVAAGGGLGLSLACDLRVASPQARFTPAFLDVAVAPDGGATWFLPRMIGHARARDVILRNRTIDAERAHDWGLVAEIADAAFEQALDIAGDLSGGPTRATTWAKDRLTHQHPLDEHLRYESQATAQSAETADFEEGVEAFLEGRKPEFE